MKKLIFIALAALLSYNGIAQTKADIFSEMPITWLGLDFTQLKFIGNASQFADAGQMTSREMRNKYFPGWNQLFIKEEKKYNVAEAVDRNSVTYAVNVTDNTNDKSTAEYFTDNPGDFQHLTADKISSLVSKYDFKGNKGLGMMFFVEGMSKDKAEASIWVTFVNMDKKTVLLTKQMTEGAGGFGFNHYWAKSYLGALKDIDMKKWKKD